MEMYIYWFIIAFSLLILEMMTGTLYLLMLSIAIGTAGLAAFSGFGLPIQLTIAATVSIIGTVILRGWKLTGQPKNPQADSLDIGQPVKVETWHDDGTARVSYRGSQWDAKLASPDIPQEKTLYIQAIQGSTLILTQQQPKENS